MIICVKVLGNFDDVSPATVPEILPATCSLRWYFPEEEGMMQHSRVSISLSYETKVINPVGESHNTSLAAPAHKQQILAPNAIKGLSIPRRLIARLNCM